MATSRNSLGAFLSRRLERPRISMATRTMPVLSAGLRYLPKACGRKEGSGGQCQPVPKGFCSAGQREQPWPEVPGSAGGSGRRKAGSSAHSPYAGEDEEGPMTGRRAGLSGMGHGPYREPGLAGGQQGWSCCCCCCWDTAVFPARGQREASRQGQPR